MNMVQQSPVVMLGGFPLFPHDHLCVFFRGKDERDRLLLPFLSDGLSAGDAVRFVADAGETSAIRSVLSDQGDLDLSEPDGGHLRNGQYAPKEFLEELAGWAARTGVAEGRVFGRIAGDMSWAEPLLSPELIDLLVAEEVTATGFLRSYQQVGLCLYDLDLFGGDLIIPMVKAHPKVWIQGTLIENPYHLPPPADDVGVPRSARAQVDGHRASP
jgi:hypothetical protein